MRKGLLIAASLGALVAISASGADLAGDDPAPRVFGRFQLALSGQRPTFGRIADLYRQHYGSVATMPSVGVDWFPWGTWIAPGLGFRVGYYKDQGSTYDPATDALAQNGPTELTLIPAQAVATVQVTPLREKAIIVRGWIGLESLYWQDVRVSRAMDEGGTATGSETILRPRASLLADTEAGASGSTYVNKGTRRGTVLGGGLCINVTALESRTAHALSGMGLSALYLQPSFERVVGQSGGADFSRDSYGLSILFESLD